MQAKPEIARIIREQIKEAEGKYEAVKKRLDRIPNTDKAKRGEVYLELLDIDKEIKKLNKELVHYL